LNKLLAQIHNLKSFIESSILANDDKLYYSLVISFRRLDYVHRRKKLWLMFLRGHEYVKHW